MNKLYPWLLAFRFKTLTAAIVPVMVGTCLAIATGHFYSWIITMYALAGAFSIQIATNLLNDAIDFKKGADTEDRLGPKRVTQSGLLSEKQVWMMGIFFLLLACAFWNSSCFSWGNRNYYFGTHVIVFSIWLYGVDHFR